MPELRRNHYIPQFMLKHWVTKGPKYSGVHCYDIRESRQIFANANGGSAFSFAIGNDLYVPEIDGERATAMERWFSGLEATLAMLVKQAHTKTDQVKLKKQADLTKITMALAGLECRSRYHINLLREAITKDPSLKPFISNNPERDERRLVLENIIHYVTEQATRLGLLEINFLHTTGRFICSDRPFINDPGLDQRFVVLTNTCMAAYKPSDNGEFRYQHIDVSNAFVDELNKIVALNARDWMIADNQAQLDRFITVVNSEDWKRNRASEKIELMPVESLTSGWSIPAELERTDKK